MKEQNFTAPMEACDDVEFVFCGVPGMTEEEVEVLKAKFESMYFGPPEPDEPVVVEGKR